MKHRDFVYVGGSAPQLNEQNHGKFLLNIQKSILISLKKRNLLTGYQCERCLTMLENQYMSNHKNEHQA